MMTTRPIAIFDFDYTLTACDTTARFIRWLLWRSPWRLCLLLVAAPAIAPMMIVKRGRKLAVRLVAWVAMLGLSDDQLTALVNVYVATVFASGETFVLQKARERIANHHTSGHKVVIATGAFERLAVAILAAEDMHGIAVVGSSVRRSLWGTVVDQHCYGANKVHMLRERGYAPPWAFVYSDHQDDLPLFERGCERFVINARPECAACLLAMLGSSAEFLSWR
jgi:phosphatidylglycerophosphatase C